MLASDFSAEVVTSWPVHVAPTLGHVDTGPRRPVFLFSPPPQEGRLSCKTFASMCLPRHLGDEISHSPIQNDQIEPSGSGPVTQSG